MGALYQPAQVTSTDADSRWPLESVKIQALWEPRQRGMRYTDGSNSIIVTAAMSHLLYAYVGKPETAQVEGFLRALAQRGVTISHLGKNDPPRKFAGTPAEAASTILDRADDWTFARDAAHKLGLTFEIHDDPRWSHATVSASCPDSSMLSLVADCAVAALDLFIAIRGVSGGGKEQPWKVVHVTERCPDELRSRFVAA